MAAFVACLVCSSASASLICAMMSSASSLPNPFMIQKALVLAKPGTAVAIFTELSVCWASVGMAGLGMLATMPRSRASIASKVVPRSVARHATATSVSTSFTSSFQIFTLRMSGEFSW